MMQFTLPQPSGDVYVNPQQHIVDSYPGVLKMIDFLYMSWLPVGSVGSNPLSIDTSPAMLTSLSLPHLP